MIVLHMNLNQVIKNLDNQTIHLIEWYKSIYLKPNPDKWHLILSVLILRFCPGCWPKYFK